MISRAFLRQKVDKTFATFGDVVWDGTYRSVEKDQYRDAQNCRGYRAYKVKVISDKFSMATNPDSMANIMEFEALIPYSNLPIEPKISDELIVSDILFKVMEFESDPAFAMWTMKVSR